MSAVIQDYPNLCITIVDDCSTDDSIDKVKQLIRSDVVDNLTSIEMLRKDEMDSSFTFNINGREVCVIKLKTNGGPSRARNIGMLHAMKAGTSFIQVLDADDAMAPNKISELIRPMLVDQNIGVTYADYTILNTVDGTSTYECKEPYSIARLQQDCIVHSGALISCAALQKVAFAYQDKDYPCFYDEDLRVAEDFLLWLKIAKHSILYHVAKDLTLVRSHPNDSTNSVSKERWFRDYQEVKRRAFYNG